MPGDHRPTTPGLPPQAWLYEATRSSGRQVTTTPGSGARLVREKDALRRINALRLALQQIAAGQGDAQELARAALAQDEQPQEEPA